MTTVLIVDDYEDWRRKVRQLLQGHPELQVTSEASDGLEAVQKAGELKPDLIVVDIGLPKLNGIEAARQIRQLPLSSKIIFLSLDNSLDVVQVALSTGAQGYVCKTDVQSDLLPAIEAVLLGKQFVSSSLKGYEFTDIPTAKAPHRHEVLFYSVDREEILKLKTRGLSLRQIAAKLGVGYGTVRERLRGTERKTPPRSRCGSYLLKVLTQWRIGGRKS
jgi:DNA-binding NarL/FixJ family response regulator